MLENQEQLYAKNGDRWRMSSATGQKPDHGLTVVSMLHLTEGTQYRMVGQDASQFPDARTTQPSLKDGYVCLMQGASKEVAVDAE